MEELTDLSSERLVEGAACEVRGEAEGAGDGGWAGRGRHGTRRGRRAAWSCAGLVVIGAAGKEEAEEMRCEDAWAGRSGSEEEEKRARGG
jgi:hypothetical protein